MINEPLIHTVFLARYLGPETETRLTVFRTSESDSPLAEARDESKLTLEINLHGFQHNIHESVRRNFQQ